MNLSKTETVTIPKPGFTKRRARIFLRSLTTDNIPQVKGLGRYSRPMKLLCKKLKGLNGNRAKAEALLRTVRSPDDPKFGALFRNRKKTKNKLPFISAPEFMKKIQNLVWLCEGWIPANQLTIIGGMMGIGKSGLSLSIAESVALGQDWFSGEKGPASPGIVLLIDVEGRERLTKRRLPKFGLHKTKNLRFWDAGHRFSLDSPEDMMQLRTFIHKVKPTLVVIDSLRGATTVRDTSPRIGEKLQELDDLAKEANVTFILVHHFRKVESKSAQERIEPHHLRGHSVIGDVTISIICLDRPDPKGKRHHLRISHVKSNAADLQPSLGMEWKRGRPVFDFEPPQPPGEETLKAQSIDLLHDVLAKGPKSVKFIERKAKENGINFHTVKKAKKALRIVQFWDTRKGKRRSMWKLPEPEKGDKE